MAEKGTSGCWDHTVAPEAQVLRGGVGRGKHAGPAKAHSTHPLPLPRSQSPGLCTFQDERRNDRREGAGAKAPRAAPLTLSEDGRLRWARWRLPCRKGHAESREGEEQNRGQGRKKSQTRGQSVERERESAVNRGE